MTDTDAVRYYYASFADREWSRLDSAEGQLEFAITTRLLERYLPPMGRVLDLGGGPGRYAQWLVDRGYDVVLADLSPELLAVARAKTSVVELVETDARDLGAWSDSEFDAVLVLGPFYHLTTEADRTVALAEIRRVAKPGALVAIALMPTTALLRRTLYQPDERARLADPAFVDALLNTGRFVNELDGRFTEAWGVDPARVEPWLVEAGFSTTTLVSAHGWAAGLEDELVETQGALRERIVELLLATSADPSILGFASHLLWLGTNTMER